MRFQRVDVDRPRVQVVLSVGVVERDKHGSLFASALSHGDASCIEGVGIVGSGFVSQDLDAAERCELAG